MAYENRTDHTTIAIKKKDLERINGYKIHHKQSNSEVITNILDILDGKVELVK